MAYIRAFRQFLRSAVLAVSASAFATFGSPSVFAQTGPDIPAPVAPPEVLSHVDAIYPSGALAEGKHADVVLVVTVDVDGHVSKVDISTSGGDDLDEASIVAVRQWTFRPASRRGSPVASRIRVPFHFAPPAPPPEVVEPQSSPNTLSPVSTAVPQQDVAAPVKPTETQRPGPPPASVPVGASPAPTEITVMGRHAPPSRGASDFQLPVGELAKVPRGNASELLKLAPGILLTNEGGEGHAEQVFMRGFDAREGQDVEFSVDGVPINQSGNLHGNGYADTHFIIPELVQSLRVLEGPFDPRQGNYAVAGSADYELGLAERGLTAKVTAGSFGTQRALLLWGPTSASTHTFGGAEVYHTDGFGQNRDADRATGMGQYEGRLGEKGSFRITGTAYGTKYHSAGVIRADDFASRKKGFYDTYDSRQGGSSGRYSLAASVNSNDGPVAFSQQLFVISADTRLLENFTGFLLDTQSSQQSPHGQRGDLLDLQVQETTIGARGSARLSDHAFGQKQSVELGYFARADQTDGTQQRLRAGSFVPYKTETDLSAKLGDVGLYADADLHAGKWMTLRGGARADLFTFNVLNNCAVQDVSRPSPSNPPGDASCLTQERFGVHREADQRATTASTAVMPRVSVILGPYRHFSLSGSYGLGVRSIDPIYISQDIKTPFASVKAVDVGLIYAQTLGDVGMTARWAFFHTHVDKDLVFSETAGRNTLANGTTRNGLVGALRATGAFFDESLNATFVRSTFDDTGLLVPYVPDLVLRSDSALWTNLPWQLARQSVRAGLALGVSYVGARPLPYGQRSQTIFTVDATATASWSRFELGLTVTNLFDREYRLGEYNYPSSFDAAESPHLVPMRQFTAGAPRGIFGSLTVNLGG